MPDKPVYLTEIADRSVKVRPPTETQYILMGRAAQKASAAAKDENFDNAIRFMVEALDIIDTLIVDDDDRAYLTKLMSQGDLQIEELLTAIGSTFPKEEAPKNGPTRVTRGRPS